MDEVTALQNRPLEPCDPLVLMDAIRVNIRSDGTVSNKPVFVALAILPDGTRDVLGLRSISASSVSPASELMSAPSNPSSIGLPLRGDRRGVGHVDWTVADVVLSRAACLAVAPKKHGISDGYATSAAFS